MREAASLLAANYRHRRMWAFAEIYDVWMRRLA